MQMNGTANDHGPHFVFMRFRVFVPPAEISLRPEIQRIDRSSILRSGWVGHSCSSNRADVGSCGRWPLMDLGVVAPGT